MMSKRMIEGLGEMKFLLSKQQHYGRQQKQQQQQQQKQQQQQQQLRTESDSNVMLAEIQKTGLSCFLWCNLKISIETKMNEAFTNYPIKSKDKTVVNALISRKEELINKIRSYENAPFTIQRLCEVLLLPANNKQITSQEGLIASLERILSVKTTLTQISAESYMDLSQKNLRLISRIKAQPIPTDPLKSIMARQGGAASAHALLLPGVHGNGRSGKLSPQKTEVVMAVICYIAFFLCTIFLWNLLATQNNL